MDQSNHKNPVIEYFEQIGVNMATAVKMVVGTHAHDDHIAGISDILRKSESALFVGSSALTSEEFMATIEIDRETEKLLRSSIRREYRKVFEIVEDRGRRRNSTPMRRAYDGRVLLEATHANGPFASVQALSPSDEAVTRSIKAMAKGFAQANDRQILTSADPNELAVALWVTAGDKDILLGADLLKGPKKCGWSAILDGFKPKRKASVYKVPHHGAPNAHHDGVWSDLLTETPLALLAPYRAGVTPRPSPEDVTRICTLADSAYITASPEQIAKSTAIRRTGTTLTGVAKNVRDPAGKSGQVRARSKIGVDTWTVDLIAPARRLCS
ncbi:hypothetical protein ACWEOE_01310 [Amycolatopsis sp. NPDC004368]